MGDTLKTYRRFRLFIGKLSNELIRHLAKHRAQVWAQPHHVELAFQHQPETQRSRRHWSPAVVGGCNHHRRHCWRHSPVDKKPCFAVAGFAAAGRGNCAAQRAAAALCRQSADGGPVRSVSGIEVSPQAAISVRLPQMLLCTLVSASTEQKPRISLSFLLFATMRVYSCAKLVPEYPSRLCLHRLGPARHGPLDGSVRAQPWPQQQPQQDQRHAVGAV